MIQEYRIYIITVHPTVLHTLFNANLSQRIRHIRWDEKKKSMTTAIKTQRPREDSQEGPAPAARPSPNPKTARGASVLPAPNEALTEADYMVHLLELQKEWAKGEKRNINHIKLILGETFKRNQEN